MRKCIWFVIAVCAFSNVLGAQPYCERGFKPKPDVDYELDLSKLNRLFEIKDVKKTQPAEETTEFQINPCDALTPPTDKQEEYCEPGTVGRVVYTFKDGKAVVPVVQPIAGEYQNSKLEPEFKVLSTEEDLSKTGSRYSLVLNGGRQNDQKYSAQITLECDESQDRNKEPAEPTIVTYQNNVLTIQWKTVFACAAKPGEKLPDNGNDQSSPADGGMSGVGIFFTTVGVLAAVYFIGGAIYNFKVYNARGLDLIPHRDFWLDLPYLIRDLIAHIVDSIMSHRRGSGGYVSV
ncbi:hypothetical protein EC973_002389 [Apophysomyces ossiformis]|uniref:Autophagy-related protein 27 n=1 Tax=Apophysomyces ossiformis TaxID=679940 RepID=A0A8H7EMX7_9FUNG|nr:hypothetical protein EC973_002389 [Apophysomyces ossiformis]